jgi:hypothetical protein
MRILLVAPDHYEIDAAPEIRILSGIHNVEILSGAVSAKDVFQAARASNKDVVHFATHGGPDHILLSTIEKVERDGTISKTREILTAEDVVQVAKLCQAQLIFFNACNTGKLASYSTRRGISFAISANEEFKDREAWKFPVTFYEFIEGRSLGSHEEFNFAKAFDRAENGDGTYSFIISLLDYLSRPSEFDVRELKDQMDSMQTEMEKFRENLSRTRTLMMFIMASLTLPTVVGTIWAVIYLLGGA